MFSRNRVLSAAVIATAFFGLSGCLSTSAQAQSDINQKEMCEVSSIEFSAIDNECSEGQKVLWAPNTFGNEQSPVIFASLYCDHRFEIVSSVGAVSCIYNPARKTIEDAMAEK
jgi:hypothetical protein